MPRSYTHAHHYNGVDRGRDYTDLANYLKRNYTEDKPPRPPKGYVFVEAAAMKYGYLYCYKYVFKPPPRKRPQGWKSGDEPHKGGLNSKIHLAVDAHGMPVRFFITSGTTADCTIAAQLIEGFQAEYLLADRV